MSFLHIKNGRLISDFFILFEEEKNNKGHNLKNLSIFLEFEAQEEEEAQLKRTMLVFTFTICIFCCVFPCRAPIIIIFVCVSRGLNWQSIMHAWMLFGANKQKRGRK
jgi:hypothetical protein